MSTVHEFDVVVAGGGPAGIAAALSAARAGARVVLIEATGAFGGMATTGMVPAFCPYSNDEAVVIRGVGLEILEKAWECGAAIRKTGAGVKEYDWVRINAEKLKLLFDQLLVESGIELRLFTQITRPVVEDGRITGLESWSKSGHEEWRAAVFVDCTGDADIAARAGCPCDSGDDQGRVQPSTLCFVIAGLRGEKVNGVLRGGPFGEIVKEASLAGELSGKFDHHHCVSQVVPEYTACGFNYKHQEDTDGTDAGSLTRAIIEGRRQAHELCEYLRNRVAGCEGGFVASTAELVGVRETRRIKGDYVMDVEHFWDCTRSDDDVASYCYYIDVHDMPTGDGEVDAYVEKHRSGHLPPGKHYGIPYRSLLPRGVENLIVAGRSISCDRAMQGSVRVMPGCFATGEAAGLAAQLAARAGCGVRDVDVGELRSKLVAQGAFIDGA